MLYCLKERLILKKKKHRIIVSNKELEVDQEKMVDLVKESQMKWITESV